MTPDYSCADRGHVWREGQRPANPKDYQQRPLFARHRGRNPGRVPVFCQHCDGVADLEAHGAFTGKGVGKAIPPAFQKVMQRAVDDALAKGIEVPTTGPVQKS